MRKRITKAIALLLALAMSASVSACSSGQSSSAASAGTSGASSSAEKVKLTFGYDEGVGDATRALIKEYNAAHPNVDVEGYNLPQNSNNLHDDFVNKLASQDTSVDVMALDVVYVSEFASAGWIDKLDNVVGSDKSAFLTGPVEGATVNNSIYAAPWITNASVLFYRTDILKKLGVTKVPPHGTSGSAFIKNSIKAPASTMLSPSRANRANPWSATGQNLSGGSAETF
jgi:multiple sugar transport system substrate-binding protein